MILRFALVLTLTGLATLSVAEPATPWKVAVIAVDPAPTAVASPCTPAAFETVATAASPEVQTACEVTSTVDPSLYEATAEKLVF